MITFCGCLGPMYGEPYCACQMKQYGLEAEMDSNPLRIAENKRSAKQWAEFAKSPEGAAWLRGEPYEAP